jgi:hypothetical protein
MARKVSTRLAKEGTSHPGRKLGMFFRKTRKADGKRVENKVSIGLVKDFPDKSQAWAAVENLHLPLNQVNSLRGVTFADLAQHYAEHELADYTESIHPKAIHDSAILRTSSVRQRSQFLVDNRSKTIERLAIAALPANQKPGNLVRTCRH